MKQTGTVQSVRGPYVDVLVKRPDACHGCGACKLANDEPRIVAARNDVGALAGDTVEIELSGDTLMRAVGLATACRWSCSCLDSCWASLSPGG